MLCCRERAVDITFVKVQALAIRFNGGFDFYVYGENNPALFIDPMGLVHYNKKLPDKVPVTGETAAALNCLEHPLQCLTNRQQKQQLASRC